MTFVFRSTLILGPLVTSSCPPHKPVSLATIRTLRMKHCGWGAVMILLKVVRGCSKDSVNERTTFVCRAEAVSEFDSFVDYNRYR